MYWLLLGLAAAVGDAGTDAVTKRFFTHLSPYAMGLVRLLFAAPFLLLAVLWVSTPSLDRTFFVVVAAMLPLEVTAMLMYMRALKVCHLSLCIPFLAFTPVFMIFTGWLFLGEALNVWGITGTLLIALGSYILGLQGGCQGFWAPFKALARETGARLMLGVAAIYSITAALFKVAVLHSQATFFGAFYPLVITGVMAAGYPWSRKAFGPVLKNNFSWGMVLAFFFILSILSVAKSLELAPAAYVIAVKRTSLLIGVLLGGLWLRERPFVPRLAGVVLMWSGVAVIAVKGFG